MSEKSKDSICAGEVERAKCRALVIFDAWQRVTGALDGNSWEWEVRGIIEDAVEIGIQEAMGVYKKLDSEE